MDDKTIEISSSSLPTGPGSLTSQAPMADDELKMTESDKTVEQSYPDAYENQTKPVQMTNIVAIPHEDEASMSEVGLPVQPVVFDMPEAKFYSKARAAGTPKDEAIKATVNEINKMIDQGMTKEEAIAATGIKEPVQWNRDAYEKAEKKVATINTAMTYLDSVADTWDDIATGNIDEVQKAKLTAAKNFLIKNGLAKEVNINTGYAITPENRVIDLRDAGSILEGNRNEMLYAIGAAMAAPFVIAGITTVPVTAPVVGGMTLAAGGAGAWSGRVSDLYRAKDKLKEMGFDPEEISSLHKNPLTEGANAAILDIAGGKAAEKVIELGLSAVTKAADKLITGVEKGKDLPRKLLNIWTIKDYPDAVNTILAVANKSKKEALKDAQKYAELGNIDTSNFKPQDWDKLILQNETLNNPTLHGYLAAVAEDKDAVGMIAKNLTERTEALDSVGTSIHLSDIRKGLEEADNTAKGMIGAVRSAIDDSFNGIKLPMEELKQTFDDTQASLAEIKGLIDERSLKTYEQVKVSLDSLLQEPTIGGLFQLRTSYGNLLRKLGLYEEVTAKRSKSLGSLGSSVRDASSLYQAIDEHIDTLIKETPYLTKMQKEDLLKLKKDSDKAYSEYAKTMQTKWVKAIQGNANKKTKNAIDELITLASERHPDYDLIMKHFTPEQQEGIEGAMLRRTLDKAKRGDSYYLDEVSRDLAEINKKVQSPAIKAEIKTAQDISTMFIQDPSVSAAIGRRRITDALGRAGLTYNPKASVLFSTWSAIYPKLQMRAVGLIDSLPGMRSAAKLFPLYGKIYKSAKDLSAVSAIKDAIITSKGDFSEFVFRLAESKEIPVATRKEAIKMQKELENAAKAFEGNQAKVKEIIEEYVKRKNEEEAARRANLPKLPSPDNSPIDVLPERELAGLLAQSPEGTPAGTAGRIHAIMNKIEEENKARETVFKMYKNNQDFRAKFNEFLEEKIKTLKEKRTANAYARFKAAAKKAQTYDDFEKAWFQYLKDLGRDVKRNEALTPSETLKKFKSGELSSKKDKLPLPKDTKLYSHGAILFDIHQNDDGSYSYQPGLGTAIASGAMFVPAKKIEDGTFSDIFTRQLMKWLPTEKARMYRGYEKYYNKMKRTKTVQLELLPKKLQKELGDGNIDKFKEEAKKELTRVSRMLKTKKPEEIGYKTLLWKKENLELGLKNPKALPSVMEVEFLSKHEKDKSFHLSDILNFPELYKEYPQLKKLEVITSYDKNSPWRKGTIYSPEEYIELNTLPEEVNQKLSVIIHETQHHVQYMEDWPRGGNPEEFERALEAAEKAMMEKIKILQDSAELVTQEMKIALSSPRTKETMLYLVELQHNMQLINESLGKIMTAAKNFPSSYSEYSRLLGEQQARIAGKAAEIAKPHPTYEMRDELEQPIIKKQNEPIPLDMYIPKDI